MEDLEASNNANNGTSLSPEHCSYTGMPLGNL
jgi:hypothetical protein